VTSPSTTTHKPGQFDGTGLKTSCAIVVDGSSTPTTLSRREMLLRSHSHNHIIGIGSPVSLWSYIVCLKLNAALHLLQEHVSEGDQEQSGRVRGRA
jgi:hypothetical protein